MSKEPPIPLIRRASEFASRVALLCDEESIDYGCLLDESAVVASALLDGSSDLAAARVAFLTHADPDYVRMQWGIWRAGGIAVPLCPSHPPPELEYVIEDSDADIVVAHTDFESLLRPLAESLGRRFATTAELRRSPVGDLPRVAAQQPAMILYTSGTTSRPKGVLSRHRTIQAQVESLISAWGWSPDDRVLLVLPLHHLHGIINVLTSALWVGGSCRMLRTFDAVAVWETFCGDDLSVFMAVPTIYKRLIGAFDEATSSVQQRWSSAARRLRLMVSGSAALPVTTMDRWRQITGHTLLERYGMTETGMILSNPLVGSRRAGFVGLPLPGVEVRLVDDDGEPVAGSGEGEVEVRGEAVFSEYWRRPRATAAAFRGDWFRSGDIAHFDGESFRILGRRSVDIIKTGGYKVSALEIEEVLRCHGAVADCSVVGIEDEEWGERVCAALLAVDDHRLDAAQLRSWAKQRLAAYKVPRDFVVLEELPRNSLGKVTKTELKRILASRLGRPSHTAVL